MAVNLSPLGGVGQQFFTNNGVPLAGGTINTYAAGTTTNVATYTSSSGTIAQANPIVLNSAGRVPSGEIWLTDGIAYKFVISDASGNLIGTYDNLVGINSNFLSFTNSQEIQTATSGQTVFTLATMQYLPGTNSLSVFVDGVDQYGPSATYAYTETSSTVVTFTSGLHVGALVKFTSTQTQNAGVTNASQIEYDPAGTNAISTNVQAKLRQIVSVQDFGAKGDGSTDDTTAFTNAISYCSSNGLCLYAPSVSTFYKINSNLNISCVFSAGTYRIFGGSGIITFGIGAIDAVYPEWWYDNGGDWTSAINAADASIIGAVDGNTLTSKAFVSFMAKTYETQSTITYNGSPWRGCGRYATVIDYRGNSYAIDATGTNSDRKQFSISGMKLLGNNATAGAIGLRLGSNYRSPRACDELEINSFPDNGILFDGPAQQMAFYNLYLYANGAVTSNKAAIAMSSTVTLDAIDFFNPNFEQNGKSGNTIASGVYLDQVGNSRNINFYGGSIESNYGGEIYIAGGSISIYSVYFETPSTNATSAVQLSSCSAIVSGCKFAGNPTNAILAFGSATVTAIQNNFASTVTYNVQSQDTAWVNVVDADNATNFKTTSTGRIVRPGPAPILFTNNGTTSELAQNATQAIITGAQEYSVYLIFATGGKESNLANWSGAWLVTVLGAPVVSTMASSSYVDCVISGSNIYIKNLNSSSQSIYWQYMVINGAS